MEITPFDLAGSLQNHNQLVQQRRAQDTQNAFAQALPMLQTDPQNALATIGKTGNVDAYSKFSTIINQMDDRKKALATDRAEALSKLLYTLKTDYKDPIIRKAVAQSQAGTLAVHGVTPEQLQSADYSDNGIDLGIRNVLSVKEQLAQSNQDRTYDAGRSDHADTVKQQDRTFNETRRHNQASEANAASVGEFGKGMQGRAYNILAQGIKDPNVRATPEYATAWQILSNPRVDPNTGTMVVPDLSAFPPPAGGQGGQPPPQRMPSVQSFAPPNPRADESASAGYANRLDASAKLIEENQDALADINQRMRSHVPIAGNYLVSPEYQKGDQAARDFINAQLRRESGAAISESEFDNARKQYLPQPGDSKDVKAQKKAARERAVKNMQMSAGNVLLPPGVVQQSSPPKGGPIVPQSQGFGAAGNDGWGQVTVHN